MVGDQCHAAKTVAHFAEPPWNVQSAPWRQIDAQLPHEHLAREMRQTMTHLDLPPLYASYAGRGKAPHRPDLRLAIVLFELRRGQRQPSPWFQDTPETCALWWLGFGIRPARSCWYEFRDRTGPYVDRLHRHVLHQAVDAELTRVERGALDGSAVAANASRRRLLNAERLQQRVHHLEAAREDDTQGDVTRSGAHVDGQDAPQPYGPARALPPGPGAPSRIAGGQPTIQPRGASGA